MLAETFLPVDLFMTRSQQLLSTFTDPIQEQVIPFPCWGARSALPDADGLYL